MPNLYQKLHAYLIPDPPSQQALDISNQALQHQNHNFGVHLIALLLTKSGDTLADVKLILPWLLSALGAPAAFISWLVPIRESLSLLPQMFIASRLKRYRLRKHFWCLGSLFQGLSIIAIGLTPIWFSGNLAGLIVLVLLIIFSLARCICSIVIKDVQGKTIDKRLRGRVSGFATSFAGWVGILFGAILYFKWLSSNSLTALSTILVVAGVLWLLAAAVYHSTIEFPDQSNHKVEHTGTELSYVELLKDRRFIHFLITRGLFISTALVAPFYVVLASKYSNGNLSALGLLLLLAGIANMVSGGIWGRLSDLSSRRVLMITGMLCGILGLIVILALYIGAAFSQSYYWYALVIFVLYVGHAGVRLGRSTYLIDMANAENRAYLVALANTVIGVLLLVLGSLFALVSKSGAEMAILVLSLTSVAASCSAYWLPDVSQPSS